MIPLHQLLRNRPTIY